MGQYTQITIAQHESFSPGDSTATKIQKLLKNLHGEFMKWCIDTLPEGLTRKLPVTNKVYEANMYRIFGEAEDHEDLKKQLEDGDLIRGTITAEHQGSVDVPFSDKGFCPFQGQAGTRMNPAPVLRIKKQSSFASKACVCDCDSLSLPRCTWLHFSL